MTSDVSIPYILRFLGVGNDKSVILSSICSVIVLFFYIFVVGSSIQSKVYTFLYRVTHESIFMTHVTSLYVDVFILLSVTIAWIYLSIKGGRTRTMMIIFFSAFLVSFLFNDKILPLVGATLTLPFVLSLILLDKFRIKITLKHDATLSLHYITLSAFLLASSGIIAWFYIS